MLTKEKVRLGMSILIGKTSLRKTCFQFLILASYIRINIKYMNYINNKYIAYILRQIYINMY